MIPIEKSKLATILKPCKGDNGNEWNFITETFSSYGLFHSKC